MTTGAGSGKTPEQLVLAGIDRREALARAATPGPWGDPSEVRYGDFGWYVSGSPLGETEDSEQGKVDAALSAINHPAHVLAVLAAAREELADAVAQQERHAVPQWIRDIQWEPDDAPEPICGKCTYDNRTEPWPCPDAEQASRTLARLLALYGEAS